MSTSHDTGAARPDPAERPATPTDARRVRGAGGVRIILRRELSTKFLTTAFALSTALFALLSLAGPLLLGSGEQEAPRLAYTAESGVVAESVARAGGDAVDLQQVSSVSAGERLVEEGDVDAALVADADSGGYEVLVDGDLDGQLGALLQAALQDQALREAATDNGVGADVLTDAAQAAAVAVVPVGEDIDAGGILLGLGFAAGAVIVVLLWGIPLATDVMQEKVSRVVEILLTSVRPWQLLAGKVLATTVIGVTQLAVILGAAVAGMALIGGAPDLGGLSWTGLGLGSVCLVLSIVTCSTLMAGLAARVERQEDLSSALQPALAVALVPLAAAVYLAFEFADSAWLDVASMAPLFNTFVLPARLAVESVPAWQVGVSLAIAVLTAIGAFAVAGRVYAGSVLRSGGRVSLREALHRQ